MVAVTKKNGTLHICLDPKDLNHAIRHEHYPLPSIEDVASRLYGAKLLNQVRTGRRPAHAWFLKINLVRMYVCVCVSAPEAMNN